MMGVMNMWDYPDPFVIDHTVVKTDTDRLGHTNNQVYLKWFEDISWQHIEPEGMSWSIQKDLGKAMAITRTEIDYLAASYETDHLQIGHGSPTQMAAYSQVDDFKSFGQKIKRSLCVQKVIMPASTF